MKDYANGDQTQQLPYTDASLIYHLKETVNALIAEANKIPEISSGTDLNSMTTSGTYVVNGVGVQNSPGLFTNYGSLIVTAINVNSLTQLLIDNRNQRWTRSRYGQGRTWTDWKGF